MKTAIVTDSNSGITQEEARLSGVFVVPMPVLIDSKQYFEGVTLSQEQFYQKLRDGKVNVSTSQPNPFDVEELWTEILKTHDALVHIPMSSGLSETCSTLSHLAHEKFDKRVFVADNQRISVTQKQSVRDAVKMVAEGKSAEEICSRLVETRAQSSIYIMVDTLKYLKKGVRLTPAAAAIGTLLRIKPILQIQGQKLDKYAKVRRFSDAKKPCLKQSETIWKRDLPNSGSRANLRFSSRIRTITRRQSNLCRKSGKHFPIYPSPTATRCL